MPGSTQTSSLSYFHHDHLGSIAAISDETGKVVERLAYDPWGKRRYPDGASDVSDSLTGKRTDRGYTEHEHLDEMGVIHMNGRVYDPLIGRMMSADASIPDPYGLQSFNRYSYVYNNPLKLFDPTGFEPWGSSTDSDGNTSHTQFNDTGNGTVSNTYTGDTYTPNEVSSSHGLGTGVAATNVAGPEGGGTAPVATYASGWGITPFGRSLIADNKYNFSLQYAVAAATQDKPVNSWDGPSRWWLVKHADAFVVSRAFEQIPAQLLAGLGLNTALTGYLTGLGAKMLSLVPRGAAKGVTNPDVVKLGFPKIGSYTPSDVGRLIGWGSGPAASVERSLNVTAREVGVMESQGLTREGAEAVRDFYVNELARNAKNITAEARIDLMQNILKWMN